jgi:hypothetical protein
MVSLSLPLEVVELELVFPKRDSSMATRPALTWNRSQPLRINWVRVGVGEGACAIAAAPQSSAGKTPRIPIRCQHMLPF